MQIPFWLWIVLIGALTAGACSLVGCFLILRRMALLGDAISHAVLPGIAIAFLLTQSRGSLPMFIGATALGLVTVALVGLLSRGGVRNDAAIGVTFTGLFAVGVILISQYAGAADLDLDCVLYGDITLAPLYTLEVGGFDIGPRAFWQMAAIFALGALLIGVFFKELKITTFDPQLAAASGISVGLVHYGLMALVSLTTVGAFEPVGAILVVAMLVIPPATAYLLTDDLAQMLLISVMAGVISAIGGFVLALWFDVAVAGAITVFAGFLLALAFTFAPRHGVLPRRVAQRKFAHNALREDVLQSLWRGREIGQIRSANVIADKLKRPEIEVVGALRRLEKSGEFANGALTQSGAQAASDLVHRHRVYETYLGELGYPEDHLHEAADRAEHVLSPQLEQEVDEAIGHPTHDPHGREIPHP